MTLMTRFITRRLRSTCFRHTGMTISFFSGSPPAVVVGGDQNICREVRVETLRKLGVPVVRRMSGGGTVYHDLGNVTTGHPLPPDPEEPMHVAKAAKKLGLRHVASAPLARSSYKAWEALEDAHDLY